MEQVHFRGKVRIIGKSAECVDGGMDEDAGEKTAAAIKDCDQQEADRDGKNDLAQGVDQSVPLLCAAAYPGIGQPLERCCA